MTPYAPFLKDTDLARLREGQSMFISMLLGGQIVYTGKISLLRMRGQQG